MPLADPGVAVRLLTTPPLRVVALPVSSVHPRTRAGCSSTRRRPPLLRFSKEPLERLARLRERFHFTFA